MKMRLLLVLCLLFNFTTYKAQEKRIALVIGNAEYVHASPLKNPVNDAELMKSTLISLGFDVIMANNIKTERQFLDTLRSFQRKSAAYNVRFVYYAGHAVQIGEENFLLPTEEKFIIKTDFSDYAIPLSKITTAFTEVENEINIVILDACRDNPFKNASESRGVIAENLLNEQSSDGVLIAYATTSGSTASDGLKESKNSVFCTSLAKNMMFPDIPFEDVLKKVRIDVKKALNQKPEYRNSLENTLYLKKSTYTDQIIEIDSLIEVGHFNQAETKLEVLLAKAPDYKLALLRRGRVGYNTMNKKYDGSHLFKADSLYPNDPEVYEYLGRYYSTIGEIEKAIKSMNEAIDFDSQDPDLFYWRARFFEQNKEQQKAESDYTQSLVLDSTIFRFFNRAQFYKRIENYELALSDYSQAISYDKDNPRWHEERADCYIAKGDFTAALKDLDKAIDLAPDDPYYYNNRADFYREQEKYDEALKDYAKALTLATNDDESSRTLNNRAIIYEGQEKFDLALEEYTKAIEIYPNYSLYYSNRARIYQKQQNYELALSDYSQAISYDKENHIWYEERAKCYIAKGDFTAALKDLDKAIDLAPDDPHYYNNRADFYREQEKYDEALKDYAKALTLATNDDESSRTLNNRAIIYEGQEKFDLALEEYTKAIEIYPNDPIYYSNRARIYQKQQNYELALTGYTQAISYEKDNPRWYNERARCYIAKGDFTAALKDLDKAIDLAPDDPYYYNNRADFYKDYKNEAELALKDYATALKLSTDPAESSRTLNNRATIYEGQEKFDLALEEYTKAIEIYPNDPIYYSNRARIYQKQQNYELALTGYTQAISYEKDNPRWYDERANCYIEKGDLTAALKDLDKAIDLAQSVAYYYNNRADFYREQEKYDEALKDYAKALTLATNDDETARAVNNRAIIYEGQEKFELALEEYSKAIEIYPNDPIYYSNRAAIYEQQEKLTEALQDYTKAIELDGKNGSWYYNRALFYEGYLEDFDIAILDYSQAIELDPSNLNYLLVRGVFYNEVVHNNKKARDDFDRMLNIDPENVDALYYIGVILEDEEKYDLAIAQYEKGIALEKTNPISAAYCYTNRAGIYQQQGKLTEAFQDYTKAIELDPKKTELYFYRADFYMNYLNKPYDALVDYSIGISLDSSNTIGWFQRGLLFSNELNDQKSAIRDFEYLLKIDSNDVSLLNWLGVLHGRLGEDSIEFDYYNRILRVHNPDLKEKNEFKINLAWAYNNLAYMYQKDNNNAKSLEYYGKSIENDPYEPLRHYERAWFNALYMGDYTSSLNDINNAIKFDEKNSYWLLQRAKINLIAKNYNAAKKDFNKLVEMNSNSVSYTSELSNFYSIVNENELANFYFDKAQSIDSNSLVFLHLYTDHLIRKEIWGTAIKTAQKAISMNIRDTIGNFQLGQIYLFNKNFVNALTSFVEAENIIEFSERVEEIDESDESQLFLSDIQKKISEIYKLLGEIELSCLYTNKAIQSLNNETRSKKREYLKLLIDMKATCQK